ncbi:uncharacterized protein LOC126833572 isoform X2 [Adelges cooleyi]|nr:uncharacterized protein LOC126833572 isoform X2 [Adelges cooleyi]XP_050420951.1 uncharacterized protein LOC126833572 isoform X2 [Adelges cooleyi]
MERPTFPLLNETLNFLKNDVVGKVSNIVRNKNRFIFHVIFEEYEKINDKSFNIDLIKENCIPFDSNVEPGLLFSCLHPNTKKWVRCYVLSISQGQAIVALIDTGEVTKTKKLKEIPDKYKNIPAITFQGEVRCISPPGILRHLMENYQDYVAYFQSFRITSDSEVYKKMFLSYEGNVMVDFIVKKWDPMLIVNDTNDNSMTFKNGCTVIMAKSESYDSRHVFVRSIDKFVRIFKEVEAYCSKNDPYIGNTLGLEEIVGVKYSDKFYRGKIVDILGYENEQNYVLYLIDSGLTISTNTVIVLPQNLKEIPPSVCLIGLKDITRKPLTPEAQQYIKSLFDNSTTMILEFNDNDTFGLDSVSLTIINNNQDVNGHIEELLQSVEETTSTNEFTPYHSVTSLLKIPHQNILNTHTCVDTANTDTQVKLTNGNDKSTLLSPGSLVYMSSFVNLMEIFVRKLEDDNDEFNFFLGEVDVYCSTAEPIQRNLVVDEMVGAKSPLDGSFYRGTVLKQVDNENYLIRFIDYGDKDTVHKSNIVDLPPELMVPTNVSAITLKGIVSNKLTPAAKDYIANLLQTYEPMIINFDPSTPLKDVVLITENGNENVNDHLRQLLNDENEENVIIESKVAEIDNIPKNIEKMCINDNVKSVALNKGAKVYITAFIDLQHIYVRKAEDESDEFLEFIDKVNIFCLTEGAPVVGYLEIGDVFGVRSTLDENFYRAKIINKTSENSYKVQYIDYGNEECVNSEDIVGISDDLKQVPSNICHVTLKDVPSCTLKGAAKDYMTFLCESELVVESIDTNKVVFKTLDNTIVNDYLNNLICEADNQVNGANEIVAENLTTQDTLVTSLAYDDEKVVLSPGSVVYMAAFVDLSDIYVRKVEDDNEEFNLLLENVNLHCSTGEPVQRNLVVDEMVGAKSPLDGSFYRGTVLKQVDNENYLIRFIDYGDKDTVHKSNIVDLPPELMIPTNVSAITLKGIVSNKLTPAAKDYIANLLQTYEPMIINFDPSTPLKDVVLITENGNENVNDHLRQLLNDEEENVINESEIAETENIPNVVNVDVHNVASTNEKYNVTNPLKSGDIVYITAYIDLNNIYVRKVDDNNEEFEKLLERVNTYCSLGNTSDSKPPDLLEIVGAKSISDGCFYRAKVTGKINEKNYNIVFVDFGYEECVNVADIVLLPVELQQLTPTIHLVGLKGANSISLNDSVNKYMEGLFSETMRVEFEDMNAVTLTIINQEQDIVNHINSLLTEIVNDDTNLNSGTQNKCSEIVLPRVPELTNQSVVTINSFVNKTDIYIKVCYDKSKMDKFLKDFSFYCASVNPLASQPTIGEIYGIQSSIDGLYYRGVIEEKLSNNQFKVIFFEIDTKDVVSTKSIVEIPNNLKQIPRSIYLVNLQGVDIRSLNARGLSYLNMLCENNVPLVIEFTQYAINSLFFVTLKTVDTNENINEHLTKLLAKNERNSPETVQVLSKGDIVYISSFDNFQNISVRRINNGTDKFKSFLENFSSSCSLEKPIDRVPRIGEIIAARQNAGSKFHRAEVIDAVNSENYNVCFIDYGSRETVHISNIVQPSDHQLKTCATSFLINLEGLPSEPLNKPVLHFINNIIKTDTFIIDSITSQNQAVLVSVNTKENLNDKIKSLLANCNTIETVNKNEKCDSEMKQFEKSIIKYSKLPLNIPNQVWVVDKISSSAYIVHTIDSRLEFERLGNIMFKDGETFQPVDKIKMNMQCAVLFSTTWHRGEVLEIIDECTARINLIDVTKVSVVCDIKEIFSLSPKYQGKSLLTKIIIQPEPHEMLYNTFKVIAKKHLEDSTVVKLVEASTNINQSYGDLNNVGYPSFSSTPIPNGGNEFDFNKDLSTPNDGNLMNGNVSQIQPLEYKSPVIQSPNRSLTPNIFTIKDVQYARWLKGSSKTLTFLCQHKDYLLMRDHLVDDAVADLEVKLQEYCVEVAYPYSPAIGELCLAKFDDGLWYRALCTKISEDDPSKNIFTVHFLDWGLEYSVDAEDLRKMSSDFAYLPASAIKCYIKDADVSKWSDSTLKTLAQLMLTQFSCIIFDKISIDSYSIKCDYIYNLVQSNQELATI